MTIGLGAGATIGARTTAAAGAGAAATGGAAAGAAAVFDVVLHPERANASVAVPRSTLVMLFILRYLIE
jgi:hypothetical protein